MAYKAMQLRKSVGLLLSGTALIFGLENGDLLISNPCHTTVFTIKTWFGNLNSNTVFGIPFSGEISGRSNTENKAFYIDWIGECSQWHLAILNQ